MAGEMTPVMRIADTTKPRYGHSVNGGVVIPLAGRRSAETGTILPDFSDSESDSDSDTKSAANATGAATAIAQTGGTATASAAAAAVSTAASKARKVAVRAAAAATLTHEIVWDDAPSIECSRGGSTLVCYTSGLITTISTTTGGFMRVYDERRAMTQRSGDELELTPTCVVFDSRSDSKIWIAAQTTIETMQLADLNGVNSEPKIVPLWDDPSPGNELSAGAGVGAAGIQPVGLMWLTADSLLVSCAATNVLYTLNTLPGESTFGMLRHFCGIPKPSSDDADAMKEDSPVTDGEFDTVSFGAPHALRLIRTQDIVTAKTQAEVDRDLYHVMTAVQSDTPPAQVIGVSSVDVSEFDAMILAFDDRCMRRINYPPQLALP